MAKLRGVSRGVTYPRTIKVGIYTATRNDTGRIVYVGQAGSIGGCEGRWKVHVQPNKKGPLAAVARKHGITWTKVWEQERTFTSEDDAVAFCKRVLDAWERWLIRSLDTFCLDANGKKVKGHPGCNLSRGGGGSLGNPIGALNQPKEAKAKGGRITGRINGRKAVESGQLASIAGMGGRIAGRISGPVNSRALAPRAGAVTRAKGRDFRTLEERAAHWGFVSVADYLAERDARNAFLAARKQDAPADEIAALKVAWDAIRRAKQDRRVREANMMANKAETDRIIATAA